MKLPPPLRLLHAGAWALLLLGLLLQLGIRDRWTLLAPLFYALPKPCLALLGLLLAGVPGRRPWRGGAALIGLGLLGGWLAVSWRLPPPSAPAPADRPTLRLLFWNLDRPPGFDAELVELVREQQPDLAACVEPGARAGEFLDAYRRALPEYQVEWMPRGILWLAKTPSRCRARGKLEGIGAFARFEVEHAGRRFPVVVADVFAHWTRSRRGQLDEVLQQAQGRADAVLVGDFNTPWESVWFDAYRGPFQHALQTAGQGWQETWPLGLPLLSLDHVWAGRDWEILEARTLWRLRGSDHAALQVTLRWR